MGVAEAGAGAGQVAIARQQRLISDTTSLMEQIITYSTLPPVERTTECWLLTLSLSLFQSVSRRASDEKLLRVQRVMKCKEKSESEGRGAAAME